MRRGNTASFSYQTVFVRSDRVNIKKVLLFLEFIIIYVGLPCAFFFKIMPLPKIPFLVALSIIAITIVVSDPFVKKRYLLKCSFPIHFYKKIIYRFLISCAALVVLTLLLIPENFLLFPRKEPLSWLAVGIIYPLFSALPQEILYRTFFFYRYNKLFTYNNLVPASTLCFAFLHIIYGNIIAVLLTLAGGWFFSKTYNRTRSLVIISIEHAFYGFFLFTIGLGTEFFF